MFDTILAVWMYVSLIGIPVLIAIIHTLGRRQPVAKDKWHGDFQLLRTF